MQGADFTGAQLQGAIFRQSALWMMMTRRANLELAESDNWEGINIDPFASFDPKIRAKGASDQVSVWLQNIPNEQVRAKALKRLAILITQPNWAKQPWNDNIKPAQITGFGDNDEKKLGELLGGLGCKSDSPPYLMRGLFRRFGLDDVRLHHIVLAKILLAPDCAGAKGLTEEELAELRKIAAAKPE